MATARAGLPIVEIHGHKGVDVPGVIDVTDYYSGLTWDSATERPWETIHVDLSMSLDAWQAMLPCTNLKADPADRNPATGFWLVVKTANSQGTLSAVAWGRVVSVAPRMSVDDASGHIQSESVSVTCESWLEVMAQSRILLVASDNAWGKDGFVYKLGSWGPALRALCQSMQERAPGVVFEQLWRILVKVLVPDTLVGAGLVFGEQVPLVHDNDTADVYTPLRAPQHKDVPGYAINAFGNVLPEATIWQWLEATFGVDPRMVELFPSLEFPSSLSLRGQSGAQAANAVPQYTALGQALGAQPVIIYRLKPMLQAGLTQDNVARALAARDGTPATQVGMPAAQALGVFQDPVDEAPGAAVDWYDFPASEVKGLPAIEWSDAERCNSIYVRTPLQPGSQVDLYGVLGTPIVNERDIERHGLRHYEVSWPFLPATIPDDAPQATETLQRQIDALIELAWTFVGQSETFASGVVQTVYKPWVKGGMWARVELRVPGARPGRVLTCYVKRVVHRVSRGGTPDDIKASTELHFSRGVLRSVETYSIPLGTAAVSGQDVARDVDVTPGAKTTTPPADVTPDGPTPHYTWTMLLSGNTNATPVQRANLTRVAQSLETIGGLLGAYPVLTPNGGLHGAKQDAAGSPVRQKTSQHRKGKAADFTVVGFAPAALKTILRAYMDDGTIPAGYLDTYAGQSFIHMDIRGAAPDIASADAGETA